MMMEGGEGNVSDSLKCSTLSGDKHLE